jgi:hypothetical protein
MTTAGTALDRPYDVDLWEAAEGQPQAVRAPLDAAAYGIDPLIHLT